MSSAFHWHAYDWAIAFGLVWLAWAYLRSDKRRRQQRRVLQLTAFAAGWFSLLLALLSPLASLATTRFWIHMLQHEVIMLVAAPLLVLASPLGSVARALPRGVAQWLYGPLRYVSPLVAWLLHAAALWIWHVPRLFNAAVQNEAVHGAQHASFFLSALLFWWSIFRNPVSPIVGVCVLTTMIHMGLLGALLTLAPVSLYPGYTLGDQQLGGLIMWVPAGFVMLAAGLGSSIDG